MEKMVANFYTQTPGSLKRDEIPPPFQEGARPGLKIRNGIEMFR